MKTFKKILITELKDKGLSRIVSCIKSVRIDGNSARVVTVDLFKQDREILKGILEQYEKGSFDGMTDCYNFDNSKPKKEVMFMYVFLENWFSDNSYDKVESELKLKYDVIDDATSQKTFGLWYDQVVWTKLSERGSF